MIAMTVSTNYVDYLRVILPLNHAFFEKWYIITAANDYATQILCADYPNVKVLIYDFQSLNKTFNFGGARRKMQLEAYKEFPDANYVFLDSDICLPPSFNDTIKSLIVEADTVYSIKRTNYKNITQFLNQNKPTGKINLWERKNTQYALGFFQLYKTKHLYDNSEDCSECDLQFSDKFKQVVHIEGITSSQLNDTHYWRGRQ